MSAMASEIASLTIVYTLFKAQIKENIKELTGDRWIPRTKGQ